MTLTDQVQGFIEERRDPGCKYMYDQNLIVTTPICQKDSEPNIARRNVYALYGNILPGKKKFAPSNQNGLQNRQNGILVLQTKGDSNGRLETTRAKIASSYLIKI